MAKTVEPKVDSVDQPLAAASAPVDVKYTVQELAAAGEKLFGVMPECVTAALRAAGLECATKQCAKEIVQKFMGRAVK